MTAYNPHDLLALKTLADLPPSPFDAPWMFASWGDRISVAEPPSFFCDCGQCWLWHGANNGKGHGKVWMPSPNATRRGRLVYLHRYSFEQFQNITLWGGLVLDHLCRRRNCFNPLHLESVTPLENYMRGDGPSFQFGRRPTDTHITQEDLEGFF